MRTLTVVLFFISSLIVNAQENLLANPEFENATLTNWSLAKLSGADGNSKLTFDSYAGNNACLVETTNVVAINKLSLKSDNHPSTGQQFKVTVMAKTDATGIVNNLGFKIQFIVASASLGNKYFASSEFKLTDNYKEYTFEQDLGIDDITEIKITFQCGGYVGNYYFDNASLTDTTPVEEPITITPVEITPITNITTTNKIIAFTFDDGPDATLTSQIAKLFEDNGGRATFFNVGNNLSGNENEVQSLLNKGHEIGNHTMSHARVPDLATDQDIYNEIVDFQELYKNTFNYTPLLFRAPFLDYGQIRNGDEVTPEEDHRVGGVLTTENLLPINAKVYANDASGTTTASQVYDKLNGNINAGDIILCHERSHTLEALQTLIPELKAAGYTFVTVSELLRIEQGWTTIAPTNEKIQIEGSNFIKNKNGELQLHRHSDAVYAGTNTTNLFNPTSARTASGIVIKFKTSSPKVNIKFRMAEGKDENPTFGIFQNNEFITTSSFPYVSESEILVESTSQHPGEEVLYKITLPNFTDVHLTGIEVEEGYDLVSFSKDVKPVYVAYGNSITHGRGQSSTHETYPYLLAQKLGYELFNLGVGGAKTSQVMAEMIRDEFDHIDMMTILIGYNDYNGEGIDAETYAERYNNVISTIRSAHPNTKLYCLTMTYTTNLTSKVTGIAADDFRNVVTTIVNEKQLAGDTNIYLIKGEDLTTESDLNDPVHLNVVGASNLANGLFTKINELKPAAKTPQETIQAMGRGINLGNTLSAPIEGNWSPIVNEQYFIDVAEAGFTNVRIPIDFFGARTSGNTSVYSTTSGTSGTYTGTSSDYVVDNNYLDRIEEVIGWALNQGLITVLDFHGSDLKKEFIHTFSSENTEYTQPNSARRAADNEKFRAIWQQIATRFKNYSDNLLFEIINEPYFNLSELEMDTLNADIISIIRTSGGNNATRKIIITGGGQNSINAPLQIAPSVLSSDDYLIASFHYYWPRAFTASSGASHNDFDWGTESDQQAVDNDFNSVKTWANTHSTAVVLGEFGADNEGGFDYSTGEYRDFGGPEDVSRAAFHSYISNKAIEIGFAFSAWDAGPESNKTIHKRTDNPSTKNYDPAGNVDTTTWVENVKNAILGKTLSVDDIVIKEDINIKVYPNPAHNILTINTTNTIEKIEVYNMLGQKMLGTKSTNQMNVESLSKGLYILKIFMKDDVIATKRFFKD